MNRYRLQGYARNTDEFQALLGQLESLDFNLEKLRQMGFAR